MKRLPIALVLIVAAGLVARVAIRLWAGQADYLENGYGFYLRLANSLIDGGGLCISPGVKCALRVPLYPLFLAPFEAAGWLYPGVVVAQAAIGAGTAIVAWAIGRELFNHRAGLIAATFTAFNPYAVVHDTALQETSLVNFLLALAVLVLLRLRQVPSNVRAAAAGLLLACAVLTTARVALAVPAAILWIWFSGGPTTVTRMRHAAAVTVVVLIVIGGWSVRNWRLVGAPTLTTESGQALWLAHNDWTFSHFPVRSIDLSAVASYASLSPARSQQLALVGNDELGFDRVHARWAAEDIAANGSRSLEYAIRKLWVVMSAQLSPARDPLVQVAFSLLFLPVHVLAVMALWQARADWQGHALVGAMVVAFLMTTAIFWAHTSHKSVLDAFLFVYAGAALTHLAAR